MEKIISLCKRRGFIFQASEIYGGIAGFWDYGPLGVELINNLKQLWWRRVVQENDAIFGIDGAIIQSPKLWEASGHVAGFTDPLVDCQNCGARHRADHLAGTDSTDLKELTLLLKDVACPNCKKKTLTAPRKYNMMMKTWVGPIEDDSSIAYLRPETAGPMFTNFSNVHPDGTLIDYTYQVTIHKKWLRIVATPLIKWYAMKAWEKAVITELKKIVERQ